MHKLGEESYAEEKAAGDSGATARRTTHFLKNLRRLMMALRVSWSQASFSTEVLIYRSSTGAMWIRINFVGIYMHAFFIENARTTLTYKAMTLGNSKYVPNVACLLNQT